MLTSLRLAFLILLFLGATAFSAHNQNAAAPAWSKKKAAKWFKKGQWEQGLKLKPHASLDVTEFARQYHAHPELWQKALAYLRDQDLANLAPGKYPLADDDLYVSVTEGPGKETDQTQWESHQKYIDIQYIARGEEKIGVAPLSDLILVKPYNPARDVANYTSDKGTYHLAQPGTYFIFFPKNPHRPSIRTEKGGSIKKVVLKIIAA